MVVLLRHLTCPTCGKDKMSSLVCISALLAVSTQHVFVFMFRGVGPGCNTREIADKLIDLKAELDDLALREHELDQQRVWVQQSIKNVTDDSNNSPYPLLHSICGC